LEEKMYCPKCATQNNEDARFCRSCGANLSLVPQALTGKLDDARSRRRHRRSGSEDPISLSEGITKAFMGVGFMIVALSLLTFTRQWWGIFMFLPGFFMFGRGVAEIVASKQMLDARRNEGRPLASPPASTNEIYSPDTAKISPPPSVTETTTRHLDHSDVPGKGAS
jgi:hypothetical protein